MKNEDQPIEVRLISAKETYDLRHRVLRPDKKVYTPNPEDVLPTTFHVGAFLENKIVGVGSFQLEDFSDLPAKKTYRLRGMATEPLLRQKGIGALVLTYGVHELTNRGCDLLWFNAREVAFAFYERMGFEYLGEMFDMPEIGPHKVMYRYLNL